MNPATACATVLVDELVRHGVREAVLCPGSRSAPLAFALHAADAAGSLRLHVRTDERTAAFLALGLAKATGRAVPVVTTSGTAVANLHPAVLEAAHAGVPLLLLTADRPPELRGTGANQTTAAGRHLRPTASGGSTTSARRTSGPARSSDWRSIASRAVVEAQGQRGGAPGPVHLNLPFREPLVPDGTRLRHAAGGRGGRRCLDLGGAPVRCRRNRSRTTAGAPWCWSVTYRSPVRTGVQQQPTLRERTVGRCVAEPSSGGARARGTCRTARCCSAAPTGWTRTCRNGSSWSDVRRSPARSPACSRTPCPGRRPRRARRPLARSRPLGSGASTRWPPSTIRPGPGIPAHPDWLRTWQDAGSAVATGGLAAGRRTRGPAVRPSRARC